MGWLHDGHRELVARARAENATVVVTIFVNPRQFNEAADYTQYPRNEARDVAQAGDDGADFIRPPPRAAAHYTQSPDNEARGVAQAGDDGADFIWAPPVEEVYPPGFDTTVSVGSVA